MKVELIYPKLLDPEGNPVSEHVEAKVVRERTSAQRGLAQLVDHAIFIPLAPGDVVEFDALDVVREVTTLVDLYTYDVQFAIPTNLAIGKVLGPEDPATVTVEREMGIWKREAYCTQHAGYCYYVSAPALDWLEDRVVLNQWVAHYELVRHPGMKIDLGVALGNADYEMTKGPWS